MLRKSAIIVFLLILASVNVMDVKGSATSSMWQRSYGGSDWDLSYSLVQTSDGGYALAGSTYSFGVGEEDFWLVKTDPSGSMEWSRTYGGIDQDYAYSLIQTSDGGFLLVGSTSSFGAGSYDVWIVKTAQRGEMEWNHTYGGVKTDIASCVIQTTDGGYAIAGKTDSYGSGKYDVLLIKTNNLGQNEWIQTYGGIEDGVAYSLIQTADGGFTIAGYTSSFGEGQEDLWIIKTDEMGIKEWDRTYGGVNTDVASSLIQRESGGFFIAGWTDSAGEGNKDFWLVATDDNGNLEYSKTYGGKNMDIAYSLANTQNGGLALAGYTLSFGAGEEDFWLVKVDGAGNMEWNRTYGGSGTDAALSLIHTLDDGFAIAGWTDSVGAGKYDFWLVKADQNGLTLEPSKPSSSGFDVYLVVVVVILVFVGLIALIFYKRRVSRTR